MQSISLSGFHLYTIKKLVEDEMLRETILIGNKEKEIKAMEEAENLNDEEQRAIEDLKSQISMADNNIYDLTVILSVVRTGHDKEIFERMNKKHNQQESNQ